MEFFAKTSLLTVLTALLYVPAYMYGFVVLWAVVFPLILGIFYRSFAYTVPVYLNSKETDGERANGLLLLLLIVSALVGGLLSATYLSPLYLGLDLNNDGLDESILIDWFNQAVFSEDLKDNSYSKMLVLVTAINSIGLVIIFLFSLWPLRRLIISVFFSTNELSVNKLNTAKSRHVFKSISELFLAFPVFSVMLFHIYTEDLLSERNPDTSLEVLASLIVLASFLMPFTLISIAIWLSCLKRIAM